VRLRQSAAAAGCRIIIRTLHGDLPAFNQRVMQGLDNTRHHGAVSELAEAIPLVVVGRSRWQTHTPSSAEAQAVYTRKAGIS
jgi:hypothetical protein